MTKPKPTGNKVVASNRQARRDYDIIDTWECGVVLRGSEVKSLREAKVQLSDAYARFDGSELWLLGLHITAYSHSGAAMGHETERPRKLLMHRTQMNSIKPRVDQDHLSLIPLSLYFKEGRCKVEIALARGRRSYDKRQAIAKRDADLEARRAMARGRRGE